MNKISLIVIFFLLFAWGCFYPIEKQTIIIKKNITSNRPFAGCLNDIPVGTDICCDYWLSYDEQPDTADITYYISPVEIWININLYN